MHLPFPSLCNNSQAHHSSWRQVPSHSHSEEGACNPRVHPPFRPSQEGAHNVNMNTQYSDHMHMHMHMVPDLPFAQGLSPVPCSIARGRHSTCTNLATSMRSIERAVPQAASFRKQAMRRGTSRRRRMTRMGFPARRTLTLASNPWRTQSSRRRPPLRHR